MVELESHIKDMQQKMYQVWYKKIQKETCSLLLLNIVKLKTKEKLLKETTGSFFFHVL